MGPKAAICKESVTAQVYTTPTNPYIKLTTPLNPIGLFYPTQYKRNYAKMSNKGLTPSQHTSVSQKELNH